MTSSLDRKIAASKQRAEQALKQRQSLPVGGIVDVPLAMDTIKRAMKSDPDYARSWHDNIAMHLQDTWIVAAQASGAGYARDFIRTITNQAAAGFMKMCFDVDTTKHVTRLLQDYARQEVTDLPPRAGVLAALAELKGEVLETVQEVIEQASAQAFPFPTLERFEGSNVLRADSAMDERCIGAHSIDPPEFTTGPDGRRTYIRRTRSVYGGGVIVTRAAWQGQEEVARGDASR